MSQVDLDAVACRVFVCPNIGEIDRLCDSLEVEKETHSAKEELRYDAEEVKRVAKALAAAYFKKTYRQPKYASPVPVIASCVYLAGKMTRNWVTQAAIAKHCNYQETTIRKWSRHLLEEMADDLAAIAAS